jgi:signal transduction histidine kinase
MIASFEAIFGLHNAVTLFEADGSYYFGAECGDRTPDSQELLEIDNEVVGRLVLYTESFDPMYPRALRHLVTSLSMLATETWRRNLLADEVLDRYDELNLIYDVGTMFVQGLSQDEIVKNVLDETNRILRADAGVIYLWDAERSTIAPISFFGERSTPDFWSGRVRELALSTLYAYEQAQLFEADRVICAPLRYNEELLGSLVLLHEREDRSFKANDVNLLTTLTQNTALFIYAARLLDKLEHEKEQLQQTLTELKTTKDKLGRAERLSIIGQTVSSLVHDIRKPLGHVMVYAEFLSQPEIAPDERQMFAAQIMKYTEAVASMAQEMLDYTQGAENVEKSPVEVTAYLAHVADLLMPPGLERAIKLIVRSDAARGYQINVDQQRFSRVFQNLVNNAMDALEQHGGSQIEISAEPIGGDIRFMVTDDGPGVPPQIVASLFDPFVTMGKSHGTGLGLAIVDKMVSVHGGKIRYESAPGGGARFVFHLPQWQNNLR